MNSRSDSGRAPCSVTQALNSLHRPWCVRSYSARNASHPLRSAAGNPENVGGTCSPFISSGLRETIRTNGTPAVVSAGKHTTLSSTITSGRTRSTISFSRGSQYRAPEISSSHTGLIQVSSCSMVNTELGRGVAVRSPSRTGPRPAAVRAAGPDRPAPPRTRAAPDAPSRTPPRRTPHGAPGGSARPRSPRSCSSARTRSPVR